MRVSRSVIEHSFRPKLSQEVGVSRAGQSTDVRPKFAPELDGDKAHTSACPTN